MAMEILMTSLKSSGGALMDEKQKRQELIKRLEKLRDEWSTCACFLECTKANPGVASTLRFCIGEIYQAIEHD